MLLKEYGFEHIFNTYLQAFHLMGEEAEAKLVESLRIADKDKKNEFYGKRKPEKYANG